MKMRTGFAAGGRVKSGAIVHGRVGLLSTPSPAGHSTKRIVNEIYFFKATVLVSATLTFSAASSPF